MYSKREDRIRQALYEEKLPRLSHFRKIPGIRGALNEAKLLRSSHFRKMSGIRGALYETKLLSLLYFRAMHDDDIEMFHLASNIDNIGAFDDICFKAKVKGFDKPVTAFVQVKHRENKNEKLKIDLATCYNSYLKIRQLFYPRNDDVFFSGTFNETECLFFIYTNVETNLIHDDDSPNPSDFSAKLTFNHLFNTGTVNEPHNYENQIKKLVKKIGLNDQVTSLAKRIAKFITSKKIFEMSDDLLLRFHVILAQKVFDVSEIQSDGYRIASICNEFFDTNEEYLILFKDTLFKEILKNRTINLADINNLLSEYLAEPTDARRLSKLIGTIITYNNGQLKFDKQSTKDFKPGMKPMDVSRSTVDEAVELAAKDILSLPFKVPAAFGNKDLTISGSDAKKEKRIHYLALEIIELLHYYKFSKIVTIDESFNDGFLRLNGGIAGAIGNIFVLDDNTKLMKITDNLESLGNLAKMLCTKLNSEIHNLHEYKFCVKVNKFPKLSFDCCSEYEENLTRDFLSKLVICCNQADEKGVEKILKCEIESYLQPNYFKFENNVIVLKYLAVMEHWWKHSQQVILTRESDSFRRSMNNIIEDTLLRSINYNSYMKKLPTYNYLFIEDALSSLNLQAWHSSTVIVAENCVLTVAKVMQHLEYEHPIILLDLEYIANLSTIEQKVLRSELAFTNERRVMILVCDKINPSNKITIEEIAGAVRFRRTNIIITDQTSLPIINSHFPKADNIVHDKKLNLLDLAEQSQERILETATVILSGVEIRLNHLLGDWPKTGPWSGGTAAVASVIADKETVTGSHRTGDEEWNVPGMSQDPLSGSESDSPPGSPRLAPPRSPSPPSPAPT